MSKSNINVQAKIIPWNIPFNRVLRSQTDGLKFMAPPPPESENQASATRDGMPHRAGTSLVTIVGDLIFIGAKRCKQ